MTGTVNPQKSGASRSVSVAQPQQADGKKEIQPFVVRSTRKALKQHRATLKETNVRIGKLLAKGKSKAAAEMRLPYQCTLDGFAHLLQADEEKVLLKQLGVTSEQLEDARAFMREEPCDLGNVRAFATQWANAMVDATTKAEIHALPGGRGVDRFIANFNTASSRIRCYHTKVGDFATHEPQARYDIAKQKRGFVAIAASRSMWGKSGAAEAAQKPMTDAFKTELMGLKSRYGNLVGNAGVGDSYIVPVTEIMKRDGNVPGPGKEPLVYTSSAGSNPKHSTGLRLKVPRLSHKLHPDSVSPRQEGKLDAAYASDYEGLRLYNLQAAKGETVTHMAVTPKSSGVFGYPKEKSAEVLARRTLFTMSIEPNLKVKMLTVNAAESANSFARHAGVKVRERDSVPKADKG